MVFLSRFAIVQSTVIEVDIPNVQLSHAFSDKILHTECPWNDKLQLRVASCKLWVAILRKLIYELRVSFYELQF